MKAEQRQIQTGEKRRNSIVNQQHFYFFIAQIRFFQFQSIILTILVFIAWNLPLLRMLQMFVFNNANITDAYIMAMFAISKFLFTIEQFLTLNFIDSNYQNGNLLNLVIFLLLASYACFVFYLYARFKKTLKIEKMQLNIFRVFTFFIYVLSFYMFIISWTALIKGIRGGVYKYLPFAVLNIVLTFTIIFIIEFYFNQNQYLSKKSLSKLNCQQNTTIHMMKLIVAGLIAFKDYFASKNTFICIFIVVYNIILAFQFKLILKNIAYINERTQVINEFFAINTFFTYLTLTVFYLTKDYTVINNATFIMITLNSLTLWTLSLYKEKRNERLFEGDLTDTHDEIELAWRMAEYIKLLRNQCNEKFSFSSLSIIKHLKQCNDVHCFCFQYDQINGTELINNREFMLKFIISRLKYLQEQNNQSFYLKMMSINFKLNFVLNFPEIYSEFERINTSNVNMNESLKGYIIYQYKKQFELKVEQLGKQSNQIRLRELFEEQKFKNDLVQELTGVSHKNVKKYTLLSQDFCNMSNVYKLGNDITNSIKKIETRWVMFKRMETYNMRILQIFLIYFEYVLPIRIQTSQIKSLINKRLHSFKFLKGCDDATINKAIYTHRAAVFQTSFHSYDDIRIVNISHNCPSMLQLDRREIIGKEIHQIMPNYLLNPHKALIAQKLSQLDTIKHLDGIRETYFVDNKGRSFSAKIHIKISSIGSKITFYVLLLKDDENNFIVLDDNLMIQGIGRRIEREQIFYKQNYLTMFSQYCRDDIKSMLENRRSIRKTIQISQLTKKIDTKSLIKCNNLEAIDEDELKVLFNTVNYECEAEISKHYIRATSYYTVKIGQVKKSLKISDGKKNLQELRQVSKKIGTLIIASQNSNNKKMESFTQLTEMEIENKSDVFAKGGLDGENMMTMNETSSTASSYKDNSNLTYTELMVKFKQYLINHQETPQFRIPSMKLFMVLCGMAITACGFFEVYLIDASIGSLAQTYEASNLVNNINQVLEISFNNDKIMQKYCSSDSVNDTRRCKYLNGTQTFLNKHLYSLMLDSFKMYLTKQTDMFGIKYYQGLNEIVAVKLKDSIIDVPEREFMELYYHSLHNLQIIDPKGYQAYNSLNFLNENWKLMKEINDKSVDYYNQRAFYEQNSLTSIIYAYNSLLFIAIIVFILPFHIFLNHCEQKKKTIIGLYQLIDIEFCKKLIENEKTIIPMINDGYSQRSMFNLDPQGKHHVKRYSQFIYHKSHHHKLAVLFVFLLLIAFNIAIVATILQYIPINQGMSSKMHDFVVAQNQAIEDYISLKMQIFNNAPITYNKKVNSSVEFVEKLKQIYTSFGSLDDQLQGRLQSLTINDICRLSQGFLPEMQLQRCLSPANVAIMNKGIATATQKLVRNTQAYSIEYIETSTTVEQYMNNVDFKRLDEQLVFDMYIYQLVKAEIIASFKRTLTTFTKTVLVFNYTQMTFIIIAVYAAITLLTAKKITLQNLFGVILQIPQKIFTESKLVMKIVTETLIQK